MDHKFSLKDLKGTQKTDETEPDTNTDIASTFISRPGLSALRHPRSDPGTYTCGDRTLVYMRRTVQLTLLLFTAWKMFCHTAVRGVSFWVFVSCIPVLF